MLISVVMLVFMLKLVLNEIKICVGIDSGSDSALGLGVDS